MFGITSNQRKKILLLMTDSSVHARQCDSSKSRFLKKNSCWYSRFFLVECVTSFGGFAFLPTVLSWEELYVIVS